jgi:hypothetical protein
MSVGKVFSTVLTLCTATALFDSSLAVAQEKEALWKLLNEPAEQQHVFEVARRSTVFVQNPCPAAKFEIGRSYTAIGTIFSDAEGRVGNGTWKQPVDEQGCGVTRQLNVLIVVEQGQVNVSPLLPGTTRADFQVQRQAIRSALDALAATPAATEKNCNISYVADTQFLAMDNVSSGGGKGSSWRELWTLASCTQKALVPLHFTADSNGPAVSAGPSAAIRIEKLSPPTS